MSKLFAFRFTQRFPVPMETLWKFISDPRNLKTITPESMDFRIISETEPEGTYAGMIIYYTVSPFAGIRVRWVTEITHVAEGSYFVDEQRFGPYAFWHHQHLLTTVEGGVEMKDLIHYKIPFGFIGNLANRLIVSRKLNAIFEYRRKKLEEIFGSC